MNNNIKEVNLYHHLQDINKLREENFNRPRFRHAEQLLQEDGNGRKLVDIGGGACEFLRIVKNKRYQGVLVDGNAQNVARASELGFTSIESNLNHKINIETESMDGAVMLDVIEHIPNAEGLLRETWRILKYNGFLILSTPNIASIGSRLSFFKGKPPRHEGYHFRFFNMSLLNQKLGDAGFKIDKRNPIVTPKIAKLIKFGGKIIGNKKGLCYIPENWENLLVQVFVIRAIKV